MNILLSECIVEVPEKIAAFIASTQGLTKSCGGEAIEIFPDLLVAGIDLQRSFELGPGVPNLQCQ